MTILEQLAGYARERTEKAKQKRPLSTLRQQAFSMPKGSFAFENAIKKPELSFICECKKASPSRGIIVSDFPYIQIAKEYENADRSLPAFSPVHADRKTNLCTVQLPYGTDILLI